MVLSRAMPIEPPTCWVVLTSAPALPWSSLCAGAAQVGGDREDQADADAQQDQRGQDDRRVIAVRIKGS
jgi:hypothetical protein